MRAQPKVKDNMMTTAMTAAHTRVSYCEAGGGPILLDSSSSVCAPFIEAPSPGLLQRGGLGGKPRGAPFLSGGSRPGHSTHRTRGCGYRDLHHEGTGIHPGILGRSSTVLFLGQFPWIKVVLYL